jgi:hypothetical protein
MVIILGLTSKACSLAYIWGAFLFKRLSTLGREQAHNALD